VEPELESREKRTARLLRESFLDLNDMSPTILSEIGLVGDRLKLPHELPHFSTLRSAYMAPSHENTDLMRAIINPIEGIPEKLDAGKPLTDKELFAAEAVIALYGRPALLVQDDDFGMPPSSWAMLAFKREEIKSVLPSVGRIEFTIPGLGHIGTGFLVGPELIMTNRHVVKVFARHVDGVWKFIPFMGIQIDFKEEKDRQSPNEFRIVEIVGVHEEFDMGLLRVAPTGTKNTKLPKPLKLSAQGPEYLDENEYVYVIGYPAKDEERNDPEALVKIFENIYNCKRLQPGKLRGLKTVIHEGASNQPVLLHDCSTLGGNSGSCLVDLATSRVIGLHYGGFYGQDNYAVPLWRLVEDPLLKSKGINFE
jgi:V8-like Glu-specific endopeptidase